MFQKKENQIYTHPLFDTQLLVRRIFLLSGLSLIPTLVLSAIILMVSQEQLALHQMILILSTIFMVILIMLYLLERFNNRLKDLLFPRKYLLNTVLGKMLTKLENVKSYRDIEETVLIDIVKTLELKGAAILIFNQEEKEIISHGSIDLMELERILNSEQAHHPVYSLFLINKQEEHAGVLVITNKISDTRLSREEAQWIQLINTYLSVILENLYLIRKQTMKLAEMLSGVSSEQEANDYDWFRKSIFQLQERERERIATDLHDTVMQDIYFVKQRMGLLQQQVKDLKAEETLRATLDHLDIINYNLRETCFHLYPHLLTDIGFVGTVQKLLDDEKNRAPFYIDLHISEQAHLESMDIETKRHLFRIVQELLANAKKHSNATKVYFRLSSEGNYCYLDYEDNGVGLQMEPLSIDGNQPSGMGLVQIKRRIILLKGKINISTPAKHGIKIIIEIPLRDEVIYGA